MVRFVLIIACLIAGSSPLAAQSASLSEPAPSLETLARQSGTPDIPGLNIVWLVPWGDRADANLWHNIVVHQSEGPPGSAHRNALRQTKKPEGLGATIWVETDGTVYWAVGEWATPKHVRLGGNRNDDKFIDNRETFRLTPNNNSIGVEFTGNYPNVRKPVTEAQIEAWRILVRVLQARYGIPSDRIFAHNWIDYKDRRYCEGCMLATIARAQGAEIALQGPPN
ncbi:MAG: N-acetylmuramoyl-L-alanine amidase [Afipia felis]|nr:N-acetylmuramoyl-L-alanine amidase [Afipia felis]